MEEWMLVCQLNANLEPNTVLQEVDWTHTAQMYPDLEEMPTFITRHRESAAERSFSTTAEPQRLRGRQLQAYTIIQAHAEAETPPPLRMIVSGTAGTGKSYLIHCLRLLLNNRVQVAAPTGVAAFNIEGHTLHSLLHLPVKGEFKDLEGERLRQMQQSLINMEYLIIDEMSMVGRTFLGQVDKRLRQVFPHHADVLFGGCSCLLFGDFGQLPPVMDLPLYTTVSRSAISDLGSAAYQIFDHAIILNQAMRQSGQDPSQVLFRAILLRIRDGNVTMDDWEELMKQTPARVSDVALFSTALHLYPTADAVAEHNVARLRDSGKPIAILKAVHTGPNAAKAPSDDAGGLQPMICLAHGARIMLTANLWVNMGLVNGSMGNVVAICYGSGGAPPHLPVAVMVHFDSYHGPTLPDGTVPIVPLRRTWCASGGTCSRLQLPIKLAWAVTIHKAQGLTLNKAVIHIGRIEFSSGLTFVACSRVRHLEDLLFDPPFPFSRVAGLSKSKRLQERLLEDSRLLCMEASTLSHHFSSYNPSPLMHSPTPSPLSPLMHSPTPSPPLYSPTPSPPHMYSPTPSPPHMYSPTPSPPLYSPTPSPPLYSPTPSPPHMYSPTPSPPHMYSPTPSPPPLYSPTPSPSHMYSPTPSPPHMYSPSPPPVHSPSPPPLYSPTPSSSHMYSPTPSPPHMYSPSPPPVHSPSPPPMCSPTPSSPVYSPSPPPMCSPTPSSPMHSPSPLHVHFASPPPTLSPPMHSPSPPHMYSPTPSPPLVYSPTPSPPPV